MKHLIIIVSVVVIGIFCYCILGSFRPTKNKQQEDINVYEGAIDSKEIEGTTIIKNLKTTTLGQKKIACAKAKKIEERTELKMSIEEGEGLIIKVKSEIALMNDHLEINRKGNKISENEYITKKAQIDRLEEKVRALKDKLASNEY